MMKLYGFAAPNMSKVLLCAEQLGLEYDFVHLNPAKGELKTPEHIARHPLGKIPVLEHDGDFFYESSAICRYMANISDSDMYKGDAKHMAIIDQWVDFMCQHIGKWIGVYFFQEIVSKRFFNKDIDEEAMSEAKGHLAEQLPVLDAQLGQGQYLCGDTMSITDPVAFALFNIQEVTNFDFSDYPNIVRWYDEIKSSAAYEKAFSNFSSNMIIH
jgi:glutathione S-transferase